MRTATTPARPASTARLVVELVTASAFVLTGVALVGLGLLLVLSTFLAAAYPCGETYLDHPSCRLAHPDAVQRAWLLVTVTPLASTITGLAVAVATFLRRRRAILPTGAALAVGLAGFLHGQALLEAAVNDVVPW